MSIQVLLIDSKNRRISEHTIKGDEVLYTCKFVEGLLDMAAHLSTNDTVLVNALGGLNKKNNGEGFQLKGCELNSMLYGNAVVMKYVLGAYSDVVITKEELAGLITFTSAKEINLIEHERVAKLKDECRKWKRVATWKA